ncbi:ribonuclease H-like domain-containing protein [Tanacetum coccineum]
MAFVSTPGSTNEANTVNVQVSTANSSVSTDSTLDSTANLSDATVYAFLANQPNGSQLVHEDLEQIHEDDLEEMDLKWQLALLSMRARKYYQRTGKKITINGSDTAGYDKSKVECFNCHKMGHFARECRGPRNQESRPRNQDSSRRTVNVEDTSSKAMVAIDGAGFDWSFMAEEEVTTNMALMAFSDSEVYNDKTCSNTCLKSFEALKTQLDNLRVEFNKSEFNLATYKRGLASVEEQLVFYKKNEVMFCDQIAVLKRDASFKDSEIIALKSEIEKLKKEKECNQIKIDKFENASKCLDKLIGSQISDNSRKGVGYNAVPPLPTGLFAPPTIDLSNSSLKEFQQPVFKGYGPKASKSVCVDTSNEIKKTPDTSLVEELVSEKGKQTVFPTKIEFVKQQDKSSDFVMYNKACFVCGSFDHIQAHCKYHQRERMVYGNNYNRVNYNYTTNRTHLNAQRNILPRAVLMKTGLKSFNTARTVNTTHPKSIVYNAKPMSCFSKSAQSTVKRPYQSKTVLTNKKFTQKVNTAKAQAVNTARPKVVNTARPKAVNTARQTSVVVNYVRDNQANAVKASISRSLMEDMLPLEEESEEERSLQNGIAKRRNMTLIEAARTMLADSKLPTTFWAEAVNIACYVQNRVLIFKPHNKTPYELFRGRNHALSFMRPFGCHVSILNTLDHLRKFNGKYDDGFFVGYSMTSKAFRVYNIRTRRVEENLHIGFLEDKPIIKEVGPKWLFDLDSLTKSMNYVPVIAGTNSNDFASSEVSIGKGTTSKETDTSQDYIMMSLWKDSLLFDSPSMNVSHDKLEPSFDAKKKDDEGVNNVTPEATNADLFGDETKMDMSNLNASYHVLTTHKYRSIKDHLLDHVIGDIQSGVQTRGMTKTANKQGLLSVAYERKPHKDLNTCLFFCFLYQEEPRRVTKALSDSAWIEEEVYVCQPPGFEDPGYPNKVYVDDIIFRSTNKELCLEFEKLMHDKISDEFYGRTHLLLRTTSTPIDTEKPLLKDSDGNDVDVHLYRDSPFDLVAYSESDYVGASLDRKSTTGGCQFLRCKLLSWQCKKQTVVATSSTKAEYVAAASCYGQAKHIEYLMLNASPLKHVKRGRDTKIPQSSGPPVKVGDETVYKELGDRMERAATNASSLEAEQDSGNINKTQSMTTLNEPSP